MREGDGKETLPIAYVTARHPPMRSSGTYRVEAVCRFLPDHGLRPWVLTLPPAWVAQQSGDRSVLAALPDEEPRVLRPATAGDRLLIAATHIPVVRWIERELLLPDVLAAWARRAPRMVADQLGHCRLVLATSPPFSAMIAGDRLARMLGVPLVQELRDPPSFNRRLRTRTTAWTRRMRSFERRYLSRADQIVVVTPGMREQLLELHPLDPERLHVVTNGYPELEIDRGLATRDPERFTVVYVGSFQGGTSLRPESTFTPEVVLPALGALPGKPRLRIVGPVTAEQERRISRVWPTGLVEVVGLVPRPKALAEMAAADLCLVLAEDNPWWIGRKVFEYLAYGRRILAIVPEGDTSRLLSGSTKSTVVPPGDEQALARTVEDLHAQWQEGRVATGPEPEVPTDEESAAGLAGVLHLALAASSSGAIEPR